MLEAMETDWPQLHPMHMTLSERIMQEQESKSWVGVVGRSNLHTVFVIHSRGEGLTLKTMGEALEILHDTAPGVQLPHRHHGLFEWEGQDKSNIVLQSDQLDLPYIFDNKPLDSYEQQQIAVLPAADLVVTAKENHLPDSEHRIVRSIVEALRACGVQVSAPGFL
ncbi:hypothetical protein GUITHDRAFT_146941 [Guillardia theta CCMP2712]|uniref:Uncharacterized protein n=1 Tax=Guillardia theta (strain CCMP2712) TaxID=905079 RepID=L1IF10_GUITC|nr:hypothetical protein GUITHDRAFT_146941 [Guillardia theta CCMP2712]EKX34831.1 hypothetical protein GUITHDRAFT_146941 [Guillardia theta CCMP2712]|eukprot:XP_005821811.1 hypothetical protein GUITHDRAFT_146941 [Guillardia theta CCMP2712]